MTELSIIVPTFNEVANVRLTYDAVEDYISGVEVTLKASMAKLKGGAFGS